MSISKKQVYKLAVQVELCVENPFSFGPQKGDYCHETIFTSNNRAEVYAFFEDLKRKDNSFRLKIRKSIDYRHFFRARIIKDSPSHPEVVGWTPILERFIDISYRCKMQVGTRIGLSKKIYHVPYNLVDSKEFPNSLTCQESQAKANTILRTLIPNGSFKLVKITAYDSVDLLDK